VDIPEPEVPSIEVGQHLARVDGGDRLLLLDVRNAKEFESWPFEGRRHVETLHVPYFSFIEDPEGSIARLPRDREIVVLCAQGGSSAMVVELLRESAISAQNVKGGMVAYGEYLAPVRVPLTEEEAVGFEIWQLNRRGKGCLSYVVRAAALRSQRKRRQKSQ